MTGWDKDVGMDLRGLEEFDEFLDADMPIYPYPGTEPEYKYHYDHLFEFSKKSIEKYNQDTGKRYHFVELVEALMHCSFEYDSITAYFKACQPDGMIVTFVATTECPSEILSDPHLQVSQVFPCPDSGSDTSESGDPAPHPAEKLDTRFELLKV